MSEMNRGKRRIRTTGTVQPSAVGRDSSTTLGMTAGAAGLNVMPEEVMRDRALEQDANRLNSMAQQAEGIPDGRAVRTGEEEAAYNLGARL